MEDSGGCAGQHGTISLIALGITSFDSVLPEFIEALDHTLLVRSRALLNPSFFYSLCPTTQVHVVQQETKPNGERLVAMKGAPERIIDRCSEVLLGNRVVPMTPELRAEIVAHQETLSRNGLRVLG